MPATMLRHSVPFRVILLLGFALFVPTLSAETLKESHMVMTVLEAHVPAERLSNVECFGRA